MKRLAKRILFVVACLFLLGGYTAAFLKIKEEPHAIGETLLFTGMLVMLTAAVALGWVQDRKADREKSDTSRE